MSFPVGHQPAAWPGAVRGGPGQAAGVVIGRPEECGVGGARKSGRPWTRSNGGQHWRGQKGQRRSTTDSIAATRRAATPLTPTRKLATARGGGQGWMHCTESLHLRARDAVRATSSQPNHGRACELGLGSAPPASRCCMSRRRPVPCL